MFTKILKNKKSEKCPLAITPCRLSLENRENDSLTPTFEMKNTYQNHIVYKLKSYKSNSNNRIIETKFLYNITYYTMKLKIV